MTTANNAARRNQLTAIESENKATPEPGTAQTKVRRKPAKKPKAGKKAPRAKEAAAKPKADRTSKKTEVIALMKRAKGATLAEIIEATGWQKHTVRGFVSILGSKAARKIESSKSACFGSPRIESPSSPPHLYFKRRYRSQAVAAFPACVVHIAHLVT